MGHENKSRNTNNDVSVEEKLNDKECKNEESKQEDFNQNLAKQQEDAFKKIQDANPEPNQDLNQGKLEKNSSTKYIATVQQTTILNETTDVENTYESIKDTKKEGSNIPALYFDNTTDLKQNMNRSKSIFDPSQPPRNDRDGNHVPLLYYKNTTELESSINNPYLNKHFDEKRQMNQKPEEYTQSVSHYGYTTQQFQSTNSGYTSLPQKTTQRRQFETNKVSQDDQFAHNREQRPRPQLPLIDQQNSSNLTGFKKPLIPSKTPDVYPNPIIDGNVVIPIIV